MSDIARYLKKRGYTQDGVHFSWHNGNISVVYGNEVGHFQVIKLVENNWVHCADISSVKELDAELKKHISKL